MYVFVCVCVPPKGYGGDSQPDQADEPLLPLCPSPGVGQVQYMASESWNSFSNIQLEVLDSYSEVTATLNLLLLLLLFEDAMAHM